MPGLLRQGKGKSMKKMMAVYDADTRYAERLSDYVNRKERGVFTAQAFTSKEKLAEYAAKHEIDVLLCDIEMPLRSGVELVRWAKERKPELECIFLTCHAEFSFAKQAIQMGCLDYILKPVFHKAKDTGLNIYGLEAIFYL